jgi:hypothetical protein
VNIPEPLGVQPLRFRWRNLRASGGQTGTFRIDDITVTKRANIDLGIASIRTMPAVLREGRDGVVMVTVRNRGLAPAPSFGVALSIGTRSALRQLTEDGYGSGLAPDDSTVLQVPVSVRPGDSLIVCQLRYDNGSGTVATLSSLAICASPREYSIVINEIQFDPREPEPEWIELYNTSSVAVSLEGWSIHDGGTGKPAKLQPHTAMSPQSYLVVAADTAALFAVRGRLVNAVECVSGFPSLNNAGDAVVLTDGFGSVIDSVWYFPSWHNPAIDDPAGRSLERIRPELASNDPKSWTSSASWNRATPGERNSVYASVPGNGARLSVSPNPFSPDHDGRDDVAMFRCALPAGAGVFTLRVYDVKGRPVRTLADHRPIAAETFLAWDGRTETGSVAPIGPYVALLEAYDVSGSRWLEARCLVVLARAL